jgi:hypothetical protein
MKSKILFIFLVIILGIAACKKSSVFTGAKIYQQVNLKNGVMSTYTYNTDGSINTIQLNTGEKTTFAYGTNTVLMSQINNQSQTVSATSYFLNGSHYADSAYGEYQTQNSTFSYQWDGNDMLLQQNTYALGVAANIDFYTNANKNVEYVQHTTATTTTYDYYGYLLANGNTIGVQNMGENFLGVSTANLVLTDVQLNINRDTTDIISYRYRYNGANVDTMVSYHRSGALKDSIAYNYY